MSDLFHEDIPDDYVAEVFDVMVRAEQHTFQVLTKRHERLAELAPYLPWPHNVWMGVTIENRRFVHRADYLREVPAAVRFISAEPLLGPLDQLDLSGIDWLIAGGESGPRHRRIDAGVGHGPARPLPGRGCRLLLQAVGRPPPEVRRPRTRRPRVERDARADAAAGRCSATA